MKKLRNIFTAMKQMNMGFHDRDFYLYDPYGTTFQKMITSYHPFIMLTSVSLLILSTITTELVVPKVGMLENGNFEIKTSDSSDFHFWFGKIADYEKVGECTLKE